MLSSFLLIPFFTGLASSVAAGVIGSYVVTRRILSLSGSIAHCVVGGMGLCLFLKRSCGWEFLSPLQGALAAGILSSLLIGWVHLRYQEREDALIAIIWSTGMAIGIIFLSLTPGYTTELMNFLFGNILWASWSDLKLLIGLDLLILLVHALFHRKFLAVCFDPQQALMQNKNVQSLYLLLLSLIAITVVILIQAVGSILVIALLAIPPSIAGLFKRNLSSMIGLSIVISSSLTTIGICTSYELNWPTGATIALVAALFYLASLLKKRKAPTLNRSDAKISSKPLSSPAKSV